MSVYDQEVRKVKLEINTTDVNGDVQKYTVDYINPNATPEEIYTAVQQLNDLTTNYFIKVERVEYAEVWEVE